MNIKYKWTVKIAYSNNDNEINESNVIIPKDKLRKMLEKYNYFKK